MARAADDGAPKPPVDGAVRAVALRFVRNPNERSDDMQTPIRRLMLAAAILCAGPGLAVADGHTMNDQIVADLQGQGFDYVEIENGLTQTKVEAVRDDGLKVEVVYDNQSGRIIEQEVERASAEDRRRRGVEVDRRARDFVDVADGADAVDGSKPRRNDGVGKGRGRDRDDDRDDRDDERDDGGRDRDRDDDDDDDRDDDDDDDDGDDDDGDDDDDDDDEDDD